MVVRMILLVTWSLNNEQKEVCIFQCDSWAVKKKNDEGRSNDIEEWALLAHWVGRKVVMIDEIPT